RQSPTCSLQPVTAGRACAIGRLSEQGCGTRPGGRSWSSRRARCAWWEPRSSWPADGHPARWRSPPRVRQPPPRGDPGLGGLLPLVDAEHAPEELAGLGLGPLEGVPAHDGPEATAVPDAADLLQNRWGVLRLAAGEDDDPLAVEAALDDVPHPIGQRLGGD